MPIRSLIYTLATLLGLSLGVTAAPADSAAAPLDSLAAAAPDTATGVEAPPAPQAQTSEAQKPREKARKIDIVRHDFNYREQVGIAIAIMAFVALVMTSTQSWNP